MNRNGIVHLDCWSIKIFLGFWGFCLLWFLSLGLLSYGAFVHWGFSLSHHVIIWTELELCTPVSRDHMNRNGIVHLDCLNIKIFFGFLGLLSSLSFILGAFVLWCFCPLGFSLSHLLLLLHLLLLSTVFAVSFMLDVHPLTGQSIPEIG